MNRISELRNEKKLSVRDLADKLDVNYQSISRMENDKQNIDVDTLKKLCSYFNVSSDYLLCMSDIRSIDAPAVTIEKGQIIDALNKIDSTGEYAFTNIDIVKVLENFHRNKSNNVKMIYNGKEINESDVLMISNLVKTYLETKK